MCTSFPSFLAPFFKWLPLTWLCLVTLRNDPGKRLEMERTFTTPNTENIIEEGRKVPKKTRPFTLRGVGVDIPVESYTNAGWPAVGGDALKALAGKVSIDYDMLAEEEPSEDVFMDEASGEGSAVLTSTGVMGGSEEDLSVYGHAFHAFGGGKAGKEACMALAALCEVASINTLISNFIQPLQVSRQNKKAKETSLSLC